MPDLTPVDDDPFSDALPPGQNLSLQPVDYQPDFDHQIAPAGGLAQQVSGFPRQAAGLIMSGLGPLGDAGMQVGDWLRTGGASFDTRDIAPVAAGIMLGTAAPEADEGAAAAATVLKNAEPEMVTAFNKEAGAQAIAKGIRAYHGSPYDFDKFDLSKIGTGEGAQAYGSGLYFAENSSVAAEYKKNLSARFSPASLTDQVRQLEVGGKPNPFDIDQMPEFVQMASANDQEGLKQFTRDRLSRWQELTLDKTYPFPDYAKQKVAAYQGLSNALEAGQAMTMPRPIQGRMYEVNIAADPEHFLDWDKPLSEQSDQVKTALRQVVGSHRVDYPSDLNVENIVTRGNEQQRAQQLRQAGIPGIKYLDQGSRGQYTIFPKGSDQYGIMKPDGSEYPLSFSKETAQAEADRQNAYAKTHNYVVFSDDLINIVRKYGLAGLIGAAAAHFSTSPVDYQPNFSQ